MDECGLTGHIYQQPILVAVHSAGANDCCGRVNLAHDLFALIFGRVELRWRVLCSVQMGYMNEVLYSVVRCDTCDRLGTLDMNIIEIKVPVARQQSFDAENERIPTWSRSYGRRGCIPCRNDANTLRSAVRSLGPIPSIQFSQKSMKILVYAQGE